jgi:hypothetical protein
MSRRSTEEIEAPMRAKGTIGCRCICPILHPDVRAVCTGGAQRNVLLYKGPGITVEVSMCEACADVAKRMKLPGTGDV